MKKLVVVVLLLVGLFAGCSSSKETVTVCTLEENGVLETETFYAKGDKVTSYISMLEFKAEDFFEGEELDVVLTSEPYEVEEYSGVTYKEYVEDGMVYFVYEIDFSVVSNDTLVTLGLIDSSNSSSDYIGLKTTLAARENYSCVTE